jgi:hypothetical protein
MEIEIQRNIVLPIVLYGCKTWSFTLREERGLNLLDGRVRRDTLGTGKKKKESETRENYIMKRSVIYTAQQILFG